MEPDSPLAGSCRNLGTCAHVTVAGGYPGGLWGNSVVEGSGGRGGPCWLVVVSAEAAVLWQEGAPGWEPDKPGTRTTALPGQLPAGCRAMEMLWTAVSPQ